MVCRLEEGGLEVLKCLFAVLVLCLVWAPAGLAGVDWHTTEIDLGFVYRDEPQKMSFGFVNTSEETLHIFDIEPSCDCTSAQALPAAVPPHNSGNIMAFFDPMGYEGKGRVTEYIRLATSDMEAPEAELYFTVEVGIGPEPAPRALNFGSICKDESDTLDLVVNPGSDARLQVLGIESGSDCVRIEPAGGEEGGGRRFMVIACNIDCRGAVSSYVNITTSDPVREVIKVPVTANLMGTIVVDPEVIAFGPTLPGRDVARPVKIYCTEGLPFKVEKVTSTVNSVEFSIAAADDNAYELKMKIKDDAPAGRVSGQVIIETDCEGQPLLTAQVTGYVRSKEQ
jgi:hypothetical protein